MNEKLECKIPCGGVSSDPLYTDKMKTFDVTEFCLQLKGEEVDKDTNLEIVPPHVKLDIYLQMCASKDLVSDNLEGWADVMQLDIGKGFTSATWLVSTLTKSSVPILNIAYFIRLKIIRLTDNGAGAQLYVRL